MSAMPPPISAAGVKLINEAFDAIDRGEIEEALAILQKCREEHPLRYVAEGAACFAVDDLVGARRALDRADELDLDTDDLDGLWLRGDLLLREWAIAEAEAIFEKLDSIERTPELCDRLAFCAELHHDYARADEYYRAAEELDPEGFAAPPRLDDAAFMAELELAIAALPEQFQRVLDECTVEVYPLPTVEIARQGDPNEVAPDILGLFSGPSLIERSNEGMPDLPPVIYLFQRNLERASRDEGELVEEIRVTLYHEIGHLLGFDEEGVDRMGLG